MQSIYADIQMIAMNIKAILNSNAIYLKNLKAAMFLLSLVHFFYNYASLCNHIQNELTTTNNTSYLMTMRKAKS
jgi:hypothetical protein